MMLFIGVNVQNRTVLIIILVILLGKSLSESQIMVVEIKKPIFLNMLQLMRIIMPIVMILKSLEAVSETTCLKESLLKVALLIEEFQSTSNIQEKLVELKLFNQFPQHQRIQNRCICLRWNFSCFTVFAETLFQIPAGVLNTSSRRMI